MKLVLLQSNYVPWKGYFDLMAAADLFIFHDDLQYTKGDWRNRNIIKTDSGRRWITVPCGRKESRLINEVRLCDRSWQKKHLQALRNSYAATPYWEMISPWLEHIYIDCTWDYLSNLNQSLIGHIAAEFLNISTETMRSEDLWL